MLRASIDLGTNTCLLLVADWPPTSKEPTRILSDHARVVRLGQGVDQARTLHPEAKQRTLNCLKDYAEIVRQLGIDPASVICTATSQARDAKDGAGFFQEIKKETGLIFQTLTGEQEAFYTFSGALLPGMSPETSAVIDIGGGSTEITGSQEGHSLDIGSVRFTERFFKIKPTDAVTDEAFWKCKEAIDEILISHQKNLDTAVKGRELVAVAGTATTLAAWMLGLEKFDARKIDQTVMTRGDLHRMVEDLKWRTPLEREKLPGVEPGRADVLLAGALILWRVHEVLGFSKSVVSTRGLRFGVLKENLKPKVS